MITLLTSFLGVGRNFEFNLRYADRRRIGLDDLPIQIFDLVDVDLVGDALVLDLAARLQLTVAYSAVVTPKGHQNDLLVERDLGQE